MRRHGFSGRARQCMLLLLAVVTLVGIASSVNLSLIDISLAAQDSNPRSDYWRLVRANDKGYSAVSGRETNELIQGSGEVWRQLRNGPIATYGVWLMAVTVFALAGFYLYRGKVELTHPRSGNTVERWNRQERVLHWSTAILFILLAITGLSLLYGRALLIPLLGHELFSMYATLCKWVHNIAGPFFIVGLCLMILRWIKHNIPDKTDIQWCLQFGGMIGDRHPSARRMNAGEKAWFWTLVFAGLGVAVSGLILDFPNFDQERELIQLAHLAHAVLAIVLISFSLGHIYIGTIGTEGALEGMTTGQVDTTWAKQHHDLWYAEISQRQTTEPEPGPAQTPDTVS